MSWGIDIEKPDGEIIEVFDGHTYNLAPMWRLAGVFEGSAKDLHAISADVLADRAAAGLTQVVSKPSEFKDLNPENGWGDYDGFVEVLTRTATICAEHRDGTIRWNG